MEPIATVKAVLEWVTLPIKTLMILFVGCLGLLLGPLMAQKLGFDIGFWPKGFAVGFAAIAFFSFVCLLANAAEHFWYKPYAKKQETKRMISLLSGLLPDERRIVQRAVMGNSDTVSIYWTNGNMPDGAALYDLVNKGVFETPTMGSTMMSSTAYYRLTPLANSCLRIPEVREGFVRAKTG